MSKCSQTLPFVEEVKKKREKTDKVVNKGQLFMTFTFIKKHTVSS